MTLLSNCWTAAWKWSGGKEPGVLRNTVEAYSVPPEARDLYEEELQKWIEDGWLLPYDEHKYGPAKGLISLMAVVQRNKKKVRPVMDFRELNATSTRSRRTRRVLRQTAGVAEARGECLRD
ncbi:hypothetical protein GWK47_033755 [Chionoecetes opilio]|uniref:Uncharacterized protein n=1 Tax=Chionoecetes opilio TaxID=41210 RepID=A0A8J4YGP5_CHIOP|nr:hypothetical protein GWK47_033755 [Chionoecetes opilio]